MHLVITRLKFGDDFDVKRGPDFACQVVSVMNVMVPNPKFLNYPKSR